MPCLVYFLFHKFPSGLPARSFPLPKIPSLCVGTFCLIYVVDFLPSHLGEKEKEPSTSTPDPPLPASLLLPPLFSMLLYVFCLSLIPAHLQPSSHSLASAPCPTETPLSLNSLETVRPYTAWPFCSFEQQASLFSFPWNSVVPWFSWPHSPYTFLFCPAIPSQSPLLISVLFLFLTVGPPLFSSFSSPFPPTTLLPCRLLSSLWLHPSPTCWWSTHGGFWAPGLQCSTSHLVFLLGYSWNTSEAAPPKLKGCSTPTLPSVFFFLHVGS